MIIVLTYINKGYDMDKPLYSMSIDDFLDRSGVGSIKRSLSNMIYGFNHNRIRNAVPFTKSVQGFTFFTRPQLNLRSFNLRNFRPFYPLLNNKPLSVERFVRVTLDPRLPFNLEGDFAEIYQEPPIDTPLVDKFNPFIPILTNSIHSISGWPDEVAPVFTSKQGVRREQFAMVDGTYEPNEVFDLNVTFENYVSDPILKLFQTWVRYESLVFEGVLNPYWDKVIENEIDYNTRIYRITLDNTWTRVEKIAAVGAAFPISVPMGSFFDYSKDKPYNEQVKTINVRFKCIGVTYNDDILIKEFNEVNAIFNPAYRKWLDGDKTSMAVIDNIIKPYLNFRGYPYINPDTYELQWLIPIESDSYARAINIKEEEIDKKQPKVPKEFKPMDINNELII